MKNRTAISKEFVRTKVALSQQIGIGRPVIDKLLGMKGCPKLTKRGYNVQQFIDFAKTHFGRSSYALDSLPSSNAQSYDITSIRCKQMLTQIAKVEQQMAIERGDYVSRKSLSESLSNFLTNFDMHFKRQFEQELPQALEGLHAIQIREKLRNAYELIKSEFVSKSNAAYE